MAQRLRLRAVARGEVQGVGFRFAVRRLARDLDLTGFAVNQPDGSVLSKRRGHPSGSKSWNCFSGKDPGWRR